MIVNGLLEIIFKSNIVHGNHKDAQHSEKQNNKHFMQRGTSGSGFNFHLRHQRIQKVKMCSI